jgi:photosystem II stability/assembly factor-like uncharacterized protein
MHRLTRASQIILVAAMIFAIAALALGTAARTQASLSERHLESPLGGIVTALAVSQDKPDTRLASTSVGLFLTRDHGETWLRADLPPYWCTPASQLLFDVADPDTAYALGSFGLGISRDGGETWDVAAPPPGAEAYLGLVQHPVDGTIYILAHNGLLKSDDRGGSWRALPLPSDTPRLNALAPHLTLSGVLIAGTEQGFLRSVNGGRTWATPGGAPAESVAWLALDTDPDGRLLAYSSTGSHLSADDGASWEAIGDTASIAGSIASSALTSADKGALAGWLARALVPGEIPEISAGVVMAVSAAGPGRGVGLAATEKALYQTNDSGQTWTRWETALPAAPVALLASSPAEPSRLYASTPFGISVSSDGAQSWRTLAIVGQDEPSPASAMVVDPGNALSIYVLTQAGTVFHSPDGGQEWQRHSEIAESLRTAPHSLSLYSTAGGQPLPCLLSDRLYWASETDGTIGWVAVDLLDSSSRPFALLPFGASETVLITRDGATYRSTLTVPTTWTRTSGGEALDGEIGAIWVPRDGDPLYAVTAFGTLYTTSNDGWRLLRKAPDIIAAIDQAVLVSAPGSDRPVVLANTERGVALWSKSGKATLLENACPPGGDGAQLLADATPGSGAYLISGDGTLSRIDIHPFPASWLAPWLAGLSGLTALGALFLSLRTRPRTTHDRRRPVTQRGTPVPVEQYLDVPVDELAPTHKSPATALDSIEAPVSAVPAMPPTLVSRPAEPVEYPVPGASTGKSRALEVAESAPDSLARQGTHLVRELCERLGLQIHAEQAQGTLMGYMLDASKLRLSLPESLPLVMFPSASIQPEQAAEIKALAAAMGAVSPFTLVILLGQESDSAGAIDAKGTDERLLPDGLIALTTQDVARIIHADEPRSVLARLVQRTVPLSQISPFVQSGPVPRTMFYGRDYEIKALLRTLYDRSVAVVGARKIGKTSFLGLVHQQLLESADLAPVYVDCHHVTDDTGFLRALALMGDVPVESASVDVLRRVVMRLRGKPGSAGQTVVLELDEVDNLLRYDLANGLRILRIFQSLSDEGLCRFVLCGERVLDTVIRDAALPLQAFCSSLRLGYLTQAEALRLVREPLADLGIALEDPDRLSADVVSLSGRHPNILQAICQLLIERVADRSERIILHDDLEAVSRSAAFLDLFFEVCWGNATTLERLISVLMAQKAEFGLDQVRLALEAHGIRIPDRELIAALDGLAFTSLITPSGAGYAYTSDAFPRVLRETGFAQGFRDSLAEALLEESQV